MALPTPDNQPVFQPALSVMDGRNVQLRNPWRRYWARVTDNVLVLLSAVPTLFVLGVVVGILDTLELIAIETIPEMVGNVIGCLVFVTFSILYDGVFLATWGTTPGKRLFGLKVTDSLGEKLTWGKSFFRALWVNGLIGICAIIPLASLIFMIFQKNRLHRTGFTTWDEADETLVYRI